MGLITILDRIKGLSFFIKSQFVINNCLNNKMKLFNMMCILFGATGAIRMPMVGKNSESYLELAREYTYVRMMKSIPLKSRKTIMQKIQNEQTAKLRAALAKAMQEESKMQVSRRNAAEKQIKSRGRMNRFRNFHN